MTQPKSRLTLRQARLARVLGVRELAELAGLAPATIVKIEAGSQPRMPTIRKLAAALGCSPQEIDWPGDPLEELEQ